MIAKGSGAIAEEIIKKAIEHGIPIKSNAHLAEVLSFLELDEYIPFETFSAIAEILVLLYKNDRKKIK